MRLYLDTSILIRCVEGDAEEKKAALRWIDRAESAPGGTIVSSLLARAECLVKPVREDRFKEALQVVLSESHRRNLEAYVAKLQSAMTDYFARPDADGAELSHAPQRGQYLTRLMIKAKDQISIVSVDLIDWIESAGDYVYVHAQAQKHLVRETLVSLEDRMDPRKFVRIHRSVIVNIEQITMLRPNEHGDYDVILKSGVKLKLSRTYRPHFEQMTGNAL